MTVKSFLKKYDLTAEARKTNCGFPVYFVELPDHDSFDHVLNAARRAGLLWRGNEYNIYCRSIHLMDPADNAANSAAGAAERARVEAYWQARHAELTATA